MLRSLAIALMLMLMAPVSADEPAPPKPPPDDVTVSIVSEIDPLVALHVAEEVESAKTAGAKHLTIRISSPGGEVESGMFIIRAIKEVGIPTTCVVDDMAASMAAIILESPACGERVVHANSIVMFHGAAGTRKGNQRDLENGLASLAAVNKWAAQVICARTGWKVEWYLSYVVADNHEQWYVGEEAVERKAADRVIPVGA